MSTFLLIAVFLLGLVVGRLYGRMKYHYPEFQEAVALRVAKLRAERMKAEAEAERYRSEIDDSLDRRTVGSKR